MRLTNGWGGFRDPKLPGPDWLRNRLGIDFVANVAVVDVDRARNALSDELLSPLSDLPRLRRLRLLWSCGTQVTDEGLAHLTGVAQLEDLHLSHSQVETLGAIKNAVKLKALQIEASNITDAGMENLRQLTALEHLGLSCSGNITDAGLSHLQGLNNLENLYLADYAESKQVRLHFTSEGMKYLGGLTRLKNAQPRRRPDHRRGFVSSRRADPNWKCFSSIGRTSPISPISAA